MHWLGVAAILAGIIVGVSGSDVSGVISDVTLVTGFFRVPGKFNNNETSYSRWQEYFLTQIETPLIAFCDKESESVIVSLRRNKPIQVVVVDGIWSLPCYDEKMKTKYFHLRKRLRWHPDLYAIWNAKPYFLQKATEMDLYKSKYFLWVDIGSFRDPQHSYRWWPSVDKLNRLFSQRRADDMLNFAVTSADDIHDLLAVTNKNDELVKKPIIQAACFGGKKEAVQWYSTEFYRFLTLLVDKNPPGNEQQIMNNMAGIFRSRMLVADMNKASHSCGKDKWFMFQSYLASDTEKYPLCADSLEIIFDMSRSSLQKLVRLTD
jgi:hypothetical protein